MQVTHSRIKLSRSQILSFRRQVGSLDERMSMGASALRLAGWAGLQDSMPRAALLSIHARVAGAGPTIWEHSSFVQLWGPRYSAYVVAARDIAVFTLGRLPGNDREGAKAQDMARRLHSFLRGRRMAFGRAGEEMGAHPNSLRFAAPTGRVLIRWNGALQPDVWTRSPPSMDPINARLELARRYLHIFGPSTATSFACWAGIRPAEARAAVEAIHACLVPVRTPLGDAWILAKDEQGFRAHLRLAAPARLLPSGDAYYLLWGADRTLLVPDAKRRNALWTTRVWPGALLVRGHIVGVWRRSAHEVSITLWRRLSSREREAVEAEAVSLPIPSLNKSITLRWS